MLTSFSEGVHSGSALPSQLQRRLPTKPTNLREEVLRSQRAQKLEMTMPEHSWMWGVECLSNIAAKHFEIPECFSDAQLGFVI